MVQYSIWCSTGFNSTSNFNIDLNNIFGFVESYDLANFDDDCALYAFPIESNLLGYNIGTLV